jgi:hypothetical protein
VKDIALHLLDDDLGVLARNRDGDTTGLIDADAQDTFVQALAAKNQRWIDGAAALSSRITIDLLIWSGRECDTYWATVPDSGHAHVSWASDGPVPVWLDIAREFTERWVHQQQIREAVNKVGNHTATHLPTVLRTFVWAFPHQYCAEAPTGARVQLDLDSGGMWTLTCEGTRQWSLSEGPARDASARVTLRDDCGWRVLTGADYSRDELTLDGPAELCEPLLGVRSIIV